VKEYNIWYLTNATAAPKEFNQSPISLDYKTGLSKRLHPKYTISSGQLIMVEYFENYDGEKFSNLILVVNFSWIRDESGMLRERRAERLWTVVGSEDSDPEFGKDIKHDVKFYDSKQAEIADARRRQNIVDDLLSQSRSFGVYEQNQLMFRDLSTSLILYKETGDRSLVSDIMSYQAEWLDTDISEILQSSGLQVPDGTTLRLAIVGAINY